MSPDEPLALGRDPTAIRARLEITWRGPVDHDAKPAGTTLSPDFAGCVRRTSSPATSAPRPARSAVSPAATTAPCTQRFIAVVDPPGTVRACDEPCHELRNSEVSQRNQSTSDARSDTRSPAGSRRCPPSKPAVRPSPPSYSETIASLSRGIAPNAGSSRPTEHRRLP
jgi:hypothetical protein